MSDNIRLDVLYTDDRGLVSDPYVVVTTSIARQIVALARDANEEQQFPPEARIAPAKLILNPSGTMHTAQSFDMTRQIGPGIVDARHSVNDHDCKKGAAHQSEMEKAHGDDAAVEALRELTFIEGENRPYALMSWKGDEREHAACAILAAIHAGKVKGVWCDDYNLTLKLSAQELEIAALRDRVAELQSSMDVQMKSNERARTRYAEAHPQSNGRWPDRTDMVLWLMQAVDNAIKRECDAEEETARVATERDRAVARLKEISEIDRAYQRLTAERDRALERVAELEAEVNRRSAFTPAQVQAEVDSWNQKLQAAQVSVECGQKRIAKLEADLAAERERTRLWHIEAERACSAADDASAELEAERGKYIESRSVWSDTISERTAERDEARAEVERLKARKVKLPPYNTCTEIPNFADGFAHGRAAVIDAIRAAGIEVSCE